MTMYQTTLETPIGALLIQATDHGLCYVGFDMSRAQSGLSCNNDLLNQALYQLQQYFDGTRQTFDVAIDVAGTDFQNQVWNALTTIGYATTCSYGDIAKLLNNPNAVRAVGAANGKNPISIIVPCHRVIGSNGTLTGYAGGVDKKQWLLAFEQAHYDD